MKKKAPRNTSSPDKHDCSDNLTSYIAFPCHNGVHSERVILLCTRYGPLYQLEFWPEPELTFFHEEFLKNSEWIPSIVGQSKWPQNCYRILREFGIWSEKQSEICTDLDTILATHPIKIVFCIRLLLYCLNLFYYIFQCPIEGALSYVPYCIPPLLLYVFYTVYTLLALGDKSEFLIWKGDWHTEIGQVHCFAYPVSAHTCYHYLFLSTIQSSIDPIHLLAQFHPVKSFMQNSPPILPSLASAR